MRRALAWWMSAPFDEKTAVLLVVLPWAALAVLLLAAPSPSP